MLVYGVISGLGEGEASEVGGEVVAVDAGLGAGIFSETTVEVGVGEGANSSFNSR